MPQMYARMQPALSEPTLQRVLRALQDPEGLDAYCWAADPYPDKRTVQTARLQLLWKLQRNKGCCEHVSSTGHACRYSVWDWIRCPTAWTQLEWHHRDGRRNMYIGRYKLPRTLNQPRAQRTLLRVVAELDVCSLLCRDHHSVTHLQVCVCVCEKQTQF
jgi:hypothetical protein